MSEPSLPFSTRVWFAFVCLFRVLFDPTFARQAYSATSPQLPSPEPEPRLPPADKAPPVEEARAPKPVVVAERPSSDAALQLLGLFQREGRLVDFLQQDIATFPDADIGAAARVVHEGCRKALKAHAEVAAIFEQSENARITLQSDFDRKAVKLTGNVGGAAPYSGVLRHRGWRATSLTLPALLPDHDVSVLAPAEVEL